jgi:integrase
MASLVSKGGRWSLQFRLQPHQDRATIALGVMLEQDARAIGARVDILVEAHRAESPPDPSTAKWVAKLGDALHGKLAKAGLVTGRDNPDAPTVPLLGAFIDKYIEKRKANTNPGTWINFEQAKKYLVDFFGATRPIDKINRGDAEDFQLDLLIRLAENTVRRVCGRAKQFFADAIKHKLLPENPFVEMKCTFLEDRSRDRFITLDEAAKVLEACPNAQWRLLFALSRFGGMRCPSEHMRLRWVDVDWEHYRMTVHSPKTARKGKPTRLVPIFPELRPYLEAVYFAALETGELPEYVITRYRDTNANLRTQLCRILTRAGLVPWEKLFQNLRATRATELVSQGWPEFKVCAWLGHTEAVAKKHYWQVTDDDYQRAAGIPVAPKALQMALQTPDETSCNTVHDHFPAQAINPANAPDYTESQQSAFYCTHEQATHNGSEQFIESQDSFHSDRTASSWW